MSDLSQPTPELAKRILGEVGFADRFQVTEMTSTTGNVRRNLYSLEEIVENLQAGRPEDLLVKGGHPAIGYADLPALAEWIDRVLGDGELAGAVAAALAESVDKSYVHRLETVRPLMVERLHQCRAVTEEVERSPAQ